MFCFLVYGDNRQMLINPNCCITMILTYIRMNLEISPKRQIDLCLRNGQQVGLPKVDIQSNGLLYLTPRETYYIFTFYVNAKGKAVDFRPHLLESLPSYNILRDALLKRKLIARKSNVTLTSLKPGQLAKIGDNKKLFGYKARESVAKKPASEPSKGKSEDKSKSVDRGQSADKGKSVDKKKSEDQAMKKEQSPPKGRAFKSFAEIGDNIKIGVIGVEDEEDKDQSPKDEKEIEDQEKRKTEQTPLKMKAMMSVDPDTGKSTLHYIEDADEIEDEEMEVESKKVEEVPSKALKSGKEGESQTDDMKIEPKVSVAAEKKEEEISKRKDDLIPMTAEQKVEAKKLSYHLKAKSYATSVKHSLSGEAHGAQTLAQTLQKLGEAEASISNYKKRKTKKNKSLKRHKSSDSFGLGRAKSSTTKSRKSRSSEPRSHRSHASALGEKPSRKGVTKLSRVDSKSFIYQPTTPTGPPTTSRKTIEWLAPPTPTKKGVEFGGPAKNSKVDEMITIVHGSGPPGNKWWYETGQMLRHSLTRTLPGQSESSKALKVYSTAIPKLSEGTQTDPLSTGIMFDVKSGNVIQINPIEVGVRQFHRTLVECPDDDKISRTNVCKEGRADVCDHARSNVCRDTAKKVSRL